MKGCLLWITFSLTIYGQSKETLKNSPTSVLASIQQATKSNPPTIKVFNQDWVKNLKLLLPCEGVPVPKRTMRLPNAPRDYRSGTHRGIDFFANWGTPVRTVADGVVIRSDLHYEEIPADFRENMLDASSKVGHTPSDIFNSLLLGKAVFIDHGFNLVPGFRTISIYAHLSSIESKIIPGAIIKEGDKLGNSGNTGMRESTLGSKAGSHLHWELILQKDNKEIYLGRDMKNPDLYDMLSDIFN